jgi:hypothetical protein
MAPKSFSLSNFAECTPTTVSCKPHLPKSKHSVSIEEQKLGRWPTYVTKIPTSSAWSICFPNTNIFYRLLFVLALKISQIREYMHTVDAAVCPKIQQHHFALQVLKTGIEM